jgi:excinuclease ABC subunit A
VKNKIVIKGARVNNLKNIDVSINHGELTVITGVSGSGKSSLAFDTIFAEGQRRFIESMSSYARQFLGKLNKPETDYIKGIAPSIAIQQKVITNNPRSTVGTSTEIYDYLKLLFARIGTTISPKSGEIVKKHVPQDVLKALKKFPDLQKMAVVCPIHSSSSLSADKKIQLLVEQGFKRIYINNKIINIDEINSIETSLDSALLVIDRIIVKKESDENDARYIDSIQIAFSEGKGACGLLDIEQGNVTWFTNLFELDEMTFQEPSVHFFTFNNPFGACKTCEGYGRVLGIDQNLVLPNKQLSVYEGAIAPWKGEIMGEYLNQLVYNAKKFNFPIHRPISELSAEEIDILWDGNSYFMGLNKFFKFLESQTYKIQYRVMLSRYRGQTECPECKGTRLRGDANYVKINQYSIQDIVLLPIIQCLDFFNQLELSISEKEISKRILPEIIQRLSFLKDVGLGYLTLNRAANTLSGGESQRINLATALGSSLVGSIYVLDEPSIGLHPQDTQRLISVLQHLKNLGNTVLVVEHDEEIMKAADSVIDIGPLAGQYGGEVVYHGKYSDLHKAKNSLTADYLTQKIAIPLPQKRRNTTKKIMIAGARKNNLKNIHVTLPLHSLVCISGVSGSGKSTLIKEIVYPAIRTHLGLTSELNIGYDTLSGDLNLIKNVEFIDQNPIGKSSRSNPITYVKAFDDIRELFARQPLAKMRGYKPGFFSFNVEGGRCEMCEGEGTITVGMQFMADVELSCDTCKGKRYKAETLEVNYRGINIHELLAMNLTDAYSFFAASNERTEQKITEKIKPLIDVGLGYLKVGQSSSTMSGGEAQRIKLASFLSKGSTIDTLFIFDEPTTGLHFHDIEKLIIAFNALINKGNSIFVIEHNVEVMKCADWIIDLGPEGGENGGNLLFSGVPEAISELKDNSTGLFLRDKLKNKTT